MPPKAAVVNLLCTGDECTTHAERLTSRSRYPYAVSRKLPNVALQVLEFLRNSRLSQEPEPRNEPSSLVADRPTQAPAMRSLCRRDTFVGQFSAPARHSRVRNAPPGLHFRGGPVA